MCAAPIGESDRSEALDVLRGCAVLGILLMNIQMFSMPFSAYFNPTALGPSSTRDFVIWCALHLLVDQKFMTIFSLLFGAGVFLMTSRISARGGRPALIHYRRMAWLLVFGLLHAYLLWHGDILVLYALCGLWIYPARRLAPRRLLVLGAFVLAIGSSLSIAAGLSMRFWPPEHLRLLSDEFWSPPAACIQQEITAFRGSWLTQLPWRAAFAFEFHMFDIWFWGIWRATGLMLIGMALCKLGVLTGERPRSFYTRLAFLGLSIGLPLVALGLFQSHSSGWNVRNAFFLGSQWNYWGSILVSLGWIALILSWWQARASRGLLVRLAAVGRMAFSCYIGETFICTTVFYGHGLGLFGTIDRLGQIFITIAVWSVLLVAAPLWLARFRFGPLEWVWRLLTYGHVEPIVTPRTLQPAETCS